MEYPEISYGTRRRTKRASSPAIRAVCAVIIAAVVIAVCVTAYGYLRDSGIIPDTAVTTEKTAVTTSVQTTAETTSAVRSVFDISPSEKPSDTGTVPPLDKVIIICTHGFESYSDGKTVTELGKYIAEKLTASGISAQFFDLEIKSSYGSYAEAEKLLTDCDKSSTLIDLHIMPLYNGDEPQAILSGEYAQLYFTVGTTDKSAERTAEAQKLTYIADIKKSGITGEIRVSPAPLNQNLFASSLNITVGAVGNTYSEAQMTADILVDIFTEIKNWGC